MGPYMYKTVSNSIEWIAIHQSGSSIQQPVLRTFVAFISGLFNN